MHPMELVAEQLVVAIENGVKGGKWVRPWRISYNVNPVTGREFTGNNQLLLGLYTMFAEREVNETDHPKVKEAIALLKQCGAPLSQYWATLKQWNTLGATVKAGQRGFGVVLGATGKRENKLGEEEFYVYYKPYTIFNSVQVEGWTPPEEQPQPKTSEEIVEAFRRIIHTHGIVVNEGSDEAYYHPRKDEITMPPIASFVSEDAYYSVLAHEAIHWTGHSSRLDRFVTPRTTESYAFEELVAELGGTMLGGSLGMDVASDSNVLAYLAGWAKHLREDKTAGRRALSLAGKAVRYLQKGSEDVE